ncbi:MAG: DNA polymerase III subunit beta [Bacteroidales bacterium]|nr:DNA polymerase III subunit beta [Bacteroidales bacterium]
MKFIVNSQQLLKQLQSLSGVLSNNNTMPIINCFHFHLEENSLRIKTTDLSTTITATMPVETGHMDAPEEVAIPSKMLLDMVKSFTDVPLTFSVDPSTFSILVTTDGGEYNLAGLDADTYPETPTPEDTTPLIMNGDALVTSINKTYFATSNDDMHQQMSGILCEIGAEGLTFVATDAHKLVRYIRKDVSSDKEASFILPKKPITIVKDILSTRKEDTEVKLEYNSTNLAITFDNIYVICRLVDGRYPNYNAAIPKDNPNKLIIDRQSFLTALRRVAIFSSEATRQVRLSLSANQVNISAENLEFSNKAHENIPCQYEGDAMDIGFNAKFLTEMVGNIDSEQVLMEMSHPSRAGIIFPYEESTEEGKENVDSLLMLVMPVMLAN